MLRKEPLNQLFVEVIQKLYDPEILGILSRAVEWYEEDDYLDFEQFCRTTIYYPDTDEFSRKKRAGGKYLLHWMVQPLQAGFNFFQEGIIPDDILYQQLWKKFGRHQKYESKIARKTHNSDWLELVDSALDEYDRVLEWTLTIWLRSVYFPSDNPDSQRLLFQGLLNAIQKKQLELTGKKSPLPKEIQQKIERLFFPNHTHSQLLRRIANPKIQSILRRALVQYDPLQKLYFHTFLSYIRYDQETDVVTVDSSTENSIDAPFVGLGLLVNDGKIEVLGDDSPLPADIKDLIEEKFMFDKKKSKAELLLKDPLFLEILEKALVWYSSLPRKSMVLSSFVRSLKYSQNEDTITFGFNSDLPEGRKLFKGSAHAICSGEIELVGTNSPLPIHFQQLLQELFFKKATVFSEVLEREELITLLTQEVDAYVPTTYSPFHYWLTELRFENSTEIKLIRPFLKIGRKIVEDTILCSELKRFGFPQRLVEKILFKFPDNPFSLHGTSERQLHTPYFYSLVAQAFQIKPPKKGMSLSKWLRKFDFDSTTEQVFLDESINQGYFSTVCNYLEKSKINLFSQTYPIPAELATGLKQTVYSEATPEDPYAFLSKPDLPRLLHEALEWWEAHPNKTHVGFQGWLRRIRYNREKNEFCYTDSKSYSGIFGTIATQTKKGLDLLSPKSPLSEETKNLIFSVFFTKKKEEKIEKKTSMSLQDFLEDTTLMSLLQSALEWYTSRNRTGPSLNYFLKAVQYHPEKGFHFSAGKKEIGYEKPFSKISNIIKDDEQELLNHPQLPPAIKVLFYEKCNIATVPDEVVTLLDLPYLPTELWLTDKRFHALLLECLRSFQQGVPPISFRWFLSTLDLGEDNQITLNRGIGPLRSILETIPEDFDFCGPDSPFPDDLKQLIAGKFPEYGNCNLVTDYQRIPHALWFHNDLFRKEFKAALQATIALGLDIAYTTWMESATYSENEGFKLLKRGKGKWYALIKNHSVESLLEFDIPSDILQLLQTVFPKNFGSVEKTDYFKLPSPKWLASPQFQMDLLRELEKIEKPIVDYGFTWWLKNTHPSSPTAAGTTSKSPWKRLATYLDTHKAKKGIEWQEIVIGDQCPLPKNIQKLIQNLFPTNFGNNFEQIDYRRLPAKFWMDKPEFISELVIALKKTIKPQEVFFPTWLRRAEQEHRGWSKLSFVFQSLRNDGVFDFLRYIQRNYSAITEECERLLCQTFPSEFFVQKPSPNTKAHTISSIVSALEATGFKVASAPLVANHAFSTQSPTGFDNKGFYDQINSHRKASANKPAKSKTHQLALLFNLGKNEVANGSTNEKRGLLGFSHMVTRRMIREHVFEHFNGRAVTAKDSEELLRVLEAFKVQLLSVIPKSVHEIVLSNFKNITEEFLNVLTNPPSAQKLFRFDLTFEQSFVVKDLADKEGNQLLAHLPGKGKTAMSIGGAWEYLRNHGNLQKGVIFFVGTKAAVQNVWNNLGANLNPEAAYLPKIVAWNFENATVQDRYLQIAESFHGHDFSTGPLIIPLTYSMQRRQNAQHFANLLSLVKLRGYDTVSITDEAHHVLGNGIKIVKKDQPHTLFPLSNPDEEGWIYAINKSPGSLPSDVFIRSTPKNILATATPYNVSIDQLVHLVSLLKSKPGADGIVYPDFSEIQLAVEGSLELSTMIHEFMYRSPHYTLPKPTQVLLECDLGTTNHLTEIDYKLQQLSAETKLLIPHLLPLISAAENKPIVISVPYTDISKQSGGASIEYIEKALQRLGFINTGSLSSNSTEMRNKRILAEFRSDEGVDIILLPPAFTESMDMHGKRDNAIVILIGATTVRQYWQSLGRVMRPGNNAQEIFVISPVAAAGGDESPLVARQKLLQDRLGIATAILDPLQLVESTQTTSDPSSIESLLGLKKAVESETNFKTPAEKISFILQNAPSLLELPTKDPAIDANLKNWDIAKYSVLETIITTIEELNSKKTIWVRYTSIQQFEDELGSLVRRFKDLVFNFILQESLVIQSQSIAFFNQQPSEQEVLEFILDKNDNMLSNLQEPIRSTMMDQVIQSLRSLEKSRVTPSDRNKPDDTVLLLALRGTIISGHSNEAYEILKQKYLPKIKRVFNTLDEMTQEDVFQEMILHLYQKDLGNMSLSAYIRKYLKHTVEKMLAGQKGPKSYIVDFLGDLAQGYDGLTDEEILDRVLT